MFPLSQKLCLHNPPTITLLMMVSEAGFTMLLAVDFKTTAVERYSPSNAYLTSLPFEFNIHFPTRHVREESATQEVILYMDGIKIE